MALAMPCKIMKNCGSGATNKIQTKLACVLEADESSRMRMENSLQNHHNTNNTLHTSFFLYLHNWFTRTRVAQIVSLACAHHIVVCWILFDDTSSSANWWTHSRCTSANEEDFGTLSEYDHITETTELYIRNPQTKTGPWMTSSAMTSPLGAFFTTVHPRARRWCETWKTDSQKEIYRAHLETNCFGIIKNVQWWPTMNLAIFWQIPTSSTVMITFFGRENPQSWIFTPPKIFKDVFEFFFLGPVLSPHTVSIFYCVVKQQKNRNNIVRVFDENVADQKPAWTFRCLVGV